MPLLIELTGIDGSGKTTLHGDLLQAARAKGAELRPGVAFPPPERWFSAASAEIADTGSCSVPLNRMLIAALSARRLTVQRLHRERGAIVFDRHVISLVAFYSHLGFDGSHMVRNDYEDTLPNKIVFLDEPPALCHDRLTASRPGRLDNHEKHLSSLTSYQSHLRSTIANLEIPCLTLREPVLNRVDYVLNWCIS